MAHPLKLLAIDIGGGTQDILFYDEGREIENCPKLILPAPTQIVAFRIRKATAEGKDVFLSGNLMGGGACTDAIQEHIQAGLGVYAKALPAKTIHDNLNRVREMGVMIVASRPRGAVEIEMRDVDLRSLREILKAFEVKIPARFAIAVQDHGDCPTSSNRLYRFKQWQNFLDRGGNIRSLVYHKVPTGLTRMRAVRRDAPRAMLMDTGAAALWGALCDPVVAKRARKGAVIVNIGNQHALAALLRGGTVWGLFEHHTNLMSAQKLADLVERLRHGTLTNEDVFDDYGHGCAIRKNRKKWPRGAFDFVTVLGPQREIADGLGYYPAVPYGDAMLAGAFGLVAAYKATV